MSYDRHEDSAKGLVDVMSARLDGSSFSTTPLQKTTSTATVVLVCALIAGSLTCPFTLSEKAYGTEDPEWKRPGSTPSATDVAPDTLQQEIERTAAEYEEELIRVNDLGFRVKVGERRIAGIQARMTLLDHALSKQREKSDRALVALYKLQNDPKGIMEFILSAENVKSLFSNLDYLQRVGSMLLGETNCLSMMKNQQEGLRSEFERTQASLLSAHEEAQQAAQKAEEALREAQRAREKAQLEAIEMVLKFNGAGPRPDGADWGVEEGVFVEVWGQRIDAYLAGTPMAGLGTQFARAAWRYGVDPRWSPAISYIESSNGRYCIKPHNAWGWGAADSDPEGLALSWGSWEEAINAHVQGLARGYGYTISVRGAQTYCPPNWERWYEVTCSEMNRI